MANSILATYTNLTSNHSGIRTQKISKLTIHYMAARWTGPQCADYFASTTRNASSNYCVGYDGSIAVSVNESCRAWTSSSEWNDQRAVTIECGNESDSSLSGACYNALIKLCADICTRNGITPHYDGTINGTITMHKMFASTACPGTWLSNKITSGQLEADILAAMGKTANTSTSGTTAKEVYWNYDAVLNVGDYVSSCPCKIQEYNATGNCIYDNCVNVPYLGGLIPLADVTEAKGTLDGACDQVLSNDKALVWLDCSQITAVDTASNLVKVKGANSGAYYWLKPAGLCRREYV